jgi:predicted DCC family thiol-disulfide oxidoreductase YuxK
MGSPVIVRDGLPDGSAIVLYDGACGVCDKVVRAVLRIERQHTLLFAPIESTFGRGVVSRHAELAGIDSIILVERDGERGELVTVRWNAVVRIGEYAGGRWHPIARFVARLIPRALGDMAYRAFARHRHKLGRDRACSIPTPAQQARFLA